MNVLSYNIKVWRNPPEKFTPTVSANVTVSELVDWLTVMVANIKAETTDPLIHRIEINKI